MVKNNEEQMTAKQKAKASSIFLKSRRDDKRRTKSSTSSVFILRLRILLAAALVTAAVYTTRNLLPAAPNSYLVSIDQQHNHKFFFLPTNARHNTLTTATTTATSFNNSSSTTTTTQAVVDDIDTLAAQDDVDDANAIENDAMHRLCHCMVIGTQKGGTRALSAFLRFTHPNVSTYMGGMMPELQFFDHDWDKLMILNFTTNNNNNTSSSFPGPPPLLQQQQQELVAQIQEQFLERAFSRPNKRQNFIRNTHVIGMHASPDYLFQSDRVPSRVLSTCPYTKLVAILREPTSRAVSQYNHMWKYWNSTQKSAYPYSSPDEYIHHDIAQLKATGVVQDWTRVDFDSFSGSMAEREAWTRYIDMVGGNGPVGRGLYVIQLRHWFAEFDKYEKPHSDMLILESSDTIANTTKEYAKVLDFLNLPAQTLLEENVVKHETLYQGMATEETRAMLKAFFKPYNEQLYNLVGDGWDGKRW